MPKASVLQALNDKAHHMMLTNIVSDLDGTDSIPCTIPVDAWIPPRTFPHSLDRVSVRKEMTDPHRIISKHTEHTEEVYITDPDQNTKISQLVISTISVITV